MQVRQPSGFQLNYSLINTALLSIATLAFVLVSVSFKKSLKMFDQTCIDTMEAMKVRM